MVEERIFALLDAIPANTGNFGALLTTEAIEKDYYVFNDPKTMKRLSKLITSKLCDDISDYDYNQLRRFKFVPRLFMSLKMNRIATSPIFSDKGIKSDSNRMQNIHSVWPLLRKFNEEDLGGISTALCQIDELQCRLFDSIFPSLVTSINDKVNEAQGQWGDTMVEYLNSIIDVSRVENEYESFVQRVYEDICSLFAVRILSSFGDDVDGESYTTLATQGRPGPQEYKVMSGILSAFEHSLVYPDENEVFVQLRCNNFDFISEDKIHRNFKPDIMLSRSDNDSPVESSSYTVPDHRLKQRRKAPIATPFFFIELKRGRYEEIVDLETGKIKISDQEVFDVVSEILGQSVRYLLDTKTCEQFAFSCKNTHVLFKLDFESIHEFEQTANRLDDSETSLKTDPKLHYEVLPLRYLSFVNGKAIGVIDEDGKPLNLTFQAALTAVAFTEHQHLISLRSLASRLAAISSSAAEVTPSMTVTENGMSTYLKIMYLFQRFISLIPEGTLLTKVQGPVNDQGTGARDDHGDGDAGTASGSNLGGQPGAVEDHTGAGMNSSRLGFGSPDLESLEPDSAELHQYPEFPINIGPINQFYNPGAHNVPYHYSEIQCGPELDIQILKFTISEVKRFFPKIMEACPSLSKRPLNEKTLFKVFESNVWKNMFPPTGDLLECKESFDEFNDHMNTKFKKEIQILSKITKFNHSQFTRVIDNPELVPQLINCPVLIAFGHLNFEPFTPYPCDLFGNFMVTEFIEASTPRLDESHRLILTESLYQQGLEQLGLLKSIGIFHGNINQSNIIISKDESKIYFVGYGSDRNPSKNIDDMFERDRKWFIRSVVVE